MTLLHIDGFDHYSVAFNSESDLAKKFDAVDQPTANDFQMNNTTTRNSNGALEFLGGSSSANTDGAAGIFIPPTDTVVCGVAIRFNAASQSGPIFTLLDSTNVIHLGLRKTSGNRLTVYRNNTALNSAPISIRNNIWYYIEFKVTHDDTTGSYEVRVNNKTVLSETNVDTRNGGLDVIERVDLFLSGANQGQASRDYDDFYILNTSGTVNNDFLGDLRVATILPNGNGNSSQFTGSDGNSTDNYLLVDENPQDTGTYVETSGVGNLDLYTMENLPADATTVLGVQVSALSDKTDAGALTGVVAMRTNSTDYFGTGYQPSFGPASEIYFSNIWDENPNTASAWTVSDINSIEAGTKLEG